MTLFPNANQEFRNHKTDDAERPQTSKSGAGRKSCESLRCASVWRPSPQRPNAFDTLRRVQQAFPKSSAGIPLAPRSLAAFTAPFLRRAANTAREAETLTNVHESAMRIGHGVKHVVRCQEAEPF